MSSMECVEAELVYMLVASYATTHVVRCRSEAPPVVLPQVEGLDFDDSLVRFALSSANSA
jgi:hypothetical protein